MAATTNKSIVYIGLGSNLENPPEQMRKAMRALAELPRTRLVTDSGLFLSKPMTADATPQPDYYNAVAKIETELSAHELLDHLQHIELAQHRVRRQHWGPRSIDMDILMFDDLQMNDERLTLPHPGMLQRDFVLYPLQQIDDALEIPGHGMLSELIKHCPQNGLCYLGTIEGYDQ